MSQTTFTPYAGKPSGFGPTACPDELVIKVDAKSALHLARHLVETADVAMNWPDKLFTVNIFGTKEPTQ